MRSTRVTFRVNIIHQTFTVTTQNTSYHNRPTHAASMHPLIPDASDKSVVQNTDLQSVDRISRIFSLQLHWSVFHHC